MDVISQKVNTFFMFIIILLLASHLTLVTPNPTSTWVGSKYNIECTMCASCDNPCNQQPPPSPPPSSPPPSPPLCPPPPSTTTGSNYSPPPPTTDTGTGESGNYYSPPTQSVYFNYPPPAPYKNYPTPGSPDPITSYYPYYYHNSPSTTISSSTARDSFSGATLLLLALSTFCMFL